MKYLLWVCIEAEASFLKHHIYQVVDLIYVVSYFWVILTSSIDLNPWVKHSDAQRAGELIDPVLEIERDITDTELEKGEEHKIINVNTINNIQYYY